MSESTRVSTASEAPLADQVCPNCGRKRPDSFCAHCGQSGRNYMRSVWPIVADFFRETFEIDSRVFRTLKLLFFKPGQLSVEFARNRRARYLSPTRLFLFMSFLNLGATALAISNDWYSRSFSGMADPSSYSEPTQEQIRAVRAKLDSESVGRLEEVLAREPDDLGRGTLSTYIALEGVGGISYPPVMYRGLISLYHDPEALMERFMRRASLVIILSLPFYALALSVVYFGRRRFFVEHLVLTTHLLTFSLAALLIYLIPARGFITIGLWLTVSVAHFGYYLLALRRYFRESWARTIGRFLVLAFLWMIVSIAGSIVAWQLG